MQASSRCQKSGWRFPTFDDRSVKMRSLVPFHSITDQPFQPTRDAE
ncbi:MAG: hypothetical protein KME45_08860 [Stenomitos rutilans HA7619-LM2]|nr:hypothetical protein [Stenomitos rutilans HA7619-LM2]